MVIFSWCTVGRLPLDGKQLYMQKLCQSQRGRSTLCIPILAIRKQPALHFIIIIDDDMANYVKLRKPIYVCVDDMYI